MLKKIVEFSIRNKLIIILFTLTIVVAGLYSLLNIPLGAVPDITNNQVQVITTSNNLSTQEIEKFITTPVELEMANLPGVKEIRSVSKFGLSVVTIVFEERMGTYLPRQLIAEKIKTASEKIPQGFGIPEMGPITTGLGEIYQYILDVKPSFEEKYDPMELRSIQDWIVKRNLSGISGVVEINSWGGYLKQYEVSVSPKQLSSMDITMGEVLGALKSNNNISGGGYIEKSNQSYFIRGDGLIKTKDEIDNIVVKNNNGIPILIKDIGNVRLGHANRFGAITANGEGEKVMGQIMMLKDANSKEVIKEVKVRVEEVQKSLPEGVFINPILERSELISKTSNTIFENLIYGCIIVIIVVFLILGNARSALVIASVIPLALLFTLTMMYIFGIDANLMSLGALDFGIIIDGAVIIVEFVALKITLEKSDFNNLVGGKRQAIIDNLTIESTAKMMKSAIFGQVIILIVFIPILSLSGVEGKMFKPMALTFSFAIIGAMILGLTWVPVAASLFLKPQKKEFALSRFLMNLAYRSYKPVITWSYNNKTIIFGAAIISLFLTGFLFTRMGGEFVPTLDEGDFVIQPVLKTGTSLTNTIDLSTQMEKILLDNFPEVDQIVSRIGAAEVPTDPMSMEEIDVIIKLNPINTWTSAKTKEELAEKFKEALSVIPGVDYEFTQPIEMRFNELITGVRADIAIKIFGDDLGYLAKTAFKVKKLVDDIPGASDVIIEKTEGLPQMTVEYDRNKIAYYGLNIKTLNEYLSMAFGGEFAGHIFELEKRFDLVVRLDKEHRKDITNIENLLVPTPLGRQIPLKEVALIKYSEGPAKISRDNTHRRVVVSVNVRNSDLQTVVENIQQKIEKSIDLPPGYYISYGGQFENMENATRRLFIAVPFALLLIFLFLHFAFKSIKDAAMVYTAVPLSTVGGVLLLWLRDMPFSVSAGIGFIALFGIAVLNGIVLIEHLKELQEKGTLTMREIILQGTMNRLRPVLLTAAAAAMGFLPMAISTGAGAEVQRPLATVVIGGLVTSTMLTMLALPLLFAIINSKRDRTLLSRILKPTLPVAIALFLILPENSFAQNEKLSLDELITIAIDNNHDLKAAKLDYEKSKALIATAFSIDKTLFYYEYDENNIADNGYPLSIYGIEQSFSFPTVYSSQRKLNKTALDITETKYKIELNRIKLEISQTFNNTVYWINKKYYLSVLDSIYSVTEYKNQIRYDNGDISYTELLNTKANKQKASLLLKQIDYSIENEYTKLKSILQTSMTFEIDYKPLEPNEYTAPQFNSLPVYKNQLLYNQLQEQSVNLEKNKLFPDINLGYFVGTNNYANSEYYNGVMIGLGLPLFFNEQRSRIKAEKIAIEIRENITVDFKLKLKARYDALISELQQYKLAIDYYNSTGKILAGELVNSSSRSYELGEINFLELSQSLESAQEIVFYYLDNLRQYNEIINEINYLH